MGFFGNIAAKTKTGVRKSPSQSKAQPLSPGLPSSPPRFNVSGSMTEVAKLQPGLSDLSGKLGGLDVGTDALLYDEATGSLYRTSNWKDATRNSTSLIGAGGQRQRIAGVAQKTKDGETQYEMGRAGSGPASTDIVLGLNDAPPTGTEEFQDWLGKKFEEGVQLQASSHMYSSDKGTTGTGYGGFGGISWSDWVALGRPDKIGNDSLWLSDKDKQKLSEMSDEQVAGLSGFLTTRDLETRHHGIAGTLDSIGKSIGWKSMASDTLRVMSSLGSVPGIGPTARLAAAAISGYDQGGWKGAGKATLETSADMVIEGAAAAAVALSAGALAPVAAGSLVGGALAGGAVGATSGGLVSAAEYGVHSSIYGGYDEGDMWHSAGRGAVVGGVSGAVSGSLASKLPATGFSEKTQQLIDRGVRAGVSMGMLNYDTKEKPDALAYILTGATSAASSNEYSIFGEGGAGIDAAGVAQVRQAFFNDMVNSVPLGSAVRWGVNRSQQSRLKNEYGVPPAEASRALEFARRNNLSAAEVGKMWRYYGSWGAMESASRTTESATGSKFDLRDIFDQLVSPQVDRPVYPGVVPSLEGGADGLPQLVSGGSNARIYVKGAR